MKDGIYVVTAELGGDRDILYLVFNNESYYEAFIDLANLCDNGDDDEMISYIKNMQVVDELFLNVTEDMLEFIGDYDLISDILPEDCYETASSLKELTKLTKNKTILDEAEILIC